MQTRTILDQIEIRGNGTVQLRLLKQIVNGGAVLHSEPHRTSLEPHGDSAAQFAAVDAHLKTLGFEPLPASQWKRVSDHAAIAWRDVPKEVAA
jgi:hypothetical protein